MIPAKNRTKKVSNYQIFQLAINPSVGTVETIENLKNNPPNIIIAEAAIDLEYSQNNYSRKQNFVKKQKYVMSLGVYNQIWCRKVWNRKKNKEDIQKILKPTDIKFSKNYRPYNGENLDDKTLLVWRQGGIGDLLFISPNLKYLKEKYPTSKIIIACGPQYQSMVKTWRFVDKVVDLPFAVNYLFNADYHSLFEGVIERTKQAESESAYTLFSKWMGLNLPESELHPEQEIPEEELKIARAHIDSWGLKENDFIALQFRSSSPIRNPRFELWKKIVDRLTANGHKIVIVDSVNNLIMSRQFVEFMKDKHMIYNFSEFSDEILKTMAITKLSKMVIGTDSALLHIAESLKVKNFGLCGPFPGNVRLSTYKYSDWIDCKKDCAPCFQHSLHPCKNARNGYSTCYDNLNIDEVVERIENHLNKEI